MSVALLLASIRRHERFLLRAERALFAPSGSEAAVARIAQRMGVRLPGVR